MTPLVQAEGLTKQFAVKKGRDRAWLRAVDDVDLTLNPGEAVGLVGESGSGKSTVARLLLHLLRASDGVIRFDGEDVTHAPAARIAALRREMQIVFQDPHASLNPRMTIFRSIAEPLVIHQRLDLEERGIEIRRWRRSDPHRQAAAQQQHRADQQRQVPDRAARRRTLAR